MSGAPLMGNEALQVYGALQEHDVLPLARDILRQSFRIYLGPPGTSFVDLVFDRALDGGPLTGDAIRAVAVETRAVYRGLGFSERYRNYKTSSLKRTLRLLQGLPLQGSIVDIGAGSNELGELLLSKWNADETSAQVRRVVGLDLIEPGDCRRGAGLEFHKLNAVGQLPLETGSMDAVLCRFSLHHVQPLDQPLVFEESRRVLRSKGLLLLIEDTFSTSRSAICQNSLLGRFSELPSDAARFELLAALDAWSCFITEERMQFAFGFRSIEDWLGLAADFGFAPMRVDYWGLPFFSLLQAPNGVLALQRG